MDPIKRFKVIDCPFCDECHDKCCTGGYASDGTPLMKLQRRMLVDENGDFLCMHCFSGDLKLKMRDIYPTLGKRYDD